YVRFFDAIGLPAPSGQPGLPDVCVYLITVGLGKLVLHLAHYLAREVRARLVLVGRSVFPARPAWEEWLASHGEEAAISRKIRRLKDLAACGAEVVVFTADVSDEEQLRSVVAWTYGHFGGLNGVIHA